MEQTELQTEKCKRKTAKGNECGGTGPSVTEAGRDGRRERYFAGGRSFTITFVPGTGPIFAFRVRG